jgi:hypothetical protein
LDGSSLFKKGGGYSSSVQSYSEAEGTSQEPFRDATRRVPLMRRIEDAKAVQVVQQPKYSEASMA